MGLFAFIVPPKECKCRSLAIREPYGRAYSETVSASPFDARAMQIQTMSERKVVRNKASYPLL
jgi:hypothetical protein